MLTRFLTWISLVCFGVLTLTALFLARRPLCIDSKVVERMDRLGIEGTDTAYRCAVNKDVRFSTFFNENQRILSQRITAAERFLESLESFQKKVRIVVVETQPYAFQVTGYQIYIGQKLLESPGHLEKALAKIWYRERTDSFFVNNSVLEEVVSDFLVFGITGRLAIYDPIYRQDTQTPNPMWPSVLKSVQGYCESPWRLSEHIALCEKSYEEKRSLRSSVVDLSLRPLLSNTWVESFRHMSFREQNHFLRSFASFLKMDHTPELPITRPTMVADNSSPMTEAMETVKNINVFISSSEIRRDVEVYREFSDNFLSYLRNSGFSDSIGEAYFDVLYVSNEPLTPTSPSYLQFQDLAKQNPRLHLAIKDPHNLWMLPAKHSVPLKTFGQIRANRTIVEKCGEFDFNYVMGFELMTEKLMVVSACSKKVPAKYQKFIAQGPSGFGIQNKGVAFIQFHIPSILSKRAELATVPGIYELVQKRELNNPIFQSLGWKELNWNEAANAYHPKAFVDAIEWFRAPEVTEVKEN